jgi:hypothetical protein
MMHLVRLIRVQYHPAGQEWRIRMNNRWVMSKWSRLSRALRISTLTYLLKSLEICKSARSLEIKSVSSWIRLDRSKKTMPTLIHAWEAIRISKMGSNNWCSRRCFPSKLSSKHEASWIKWIWPQFSQEEELSPILQALCYKSNRSGKWTSQSRVTKWCLQTQSSKVLLHRKCIKMRVKIWSKLVTKENRLVRSLASEHLETTPMHLYKPPEAPESKFHRTQCRT